MKKDKAIAIIIALFFGGFGGHWYYLGKIKRAVIYSLFFWTFVPALITWIDIIIIACMDAGKFNQKFNV